MSSSGTYGGPQIGYTSAEVNSQLVNIVPRAAYDPLIFGGAYTGAFAWPRQGVMTVPPVVTSRTMQNSMNPSEYGSGSPYTMPTATSETGNPFHLTKSPLWWAIGFLVISLVALYKINWS